MNQRELQLVANQAAIAKPFFQTQEEYEQFRLEFRQSVKPELDRLQEARRRSEERAKQLLVR